MNFNDYNIQRTDLTSSLGNNPNKNIINSVITILNNNSNSELVKLILQRQKDDTVQIEKYEINKISTLNSYNLDSLVADQLMQVKENGIGPGEILIALTSGKWVGGTNSKYDVYVNNLGTVEVKFLGPFAESTNVSLGSSTQKNILSSKLYEFLKKFGQLIKQNPEYLKGSLTSIELDYFIRKTLDELNSPTEQKVSIQSIRLIGKFLRNNKNSDVINRGFRFNTYVSYMEDAIKASTKDAQYLMFLGTKNEITSDVDNPSVNKDGQYFILPKNDVKYYMIYRLNESMRIQIAPFQTEKDFFNKNYKEY